ncbi:uncharacterized protein F4812DRAFT_470897 [Daldinia caldariorum]|uniref:uncharacterized protein n=1 Tax=Daldinia caldariorum TaxID=326644 RepID=UPI00200885F2|nr:uncharacterized protein F4812DRAFT_470897 [Daldinia caldariorum]KAI1468274.1 hypothetical protein F4812DRAFT_470897 [Daldinia caldariorum]
MTAITKTTRGPDGSQSTLTYHLPPQTTPFAPPPQQQQQQGATSITTMPPSCSLSVFCRGLSYYVYSLNTAARDAHPLAGQRCLAVQELAASTEAGGGAGAGRWNGAGKGTRVEDGNWDGGDGDVAKRVGYNEDCWPENYFALFDNEWGELNGAPRSGNEGSASTAAFPGDRCLAGWTVACTTTITAGDGGGRDRGRGRGMRGDVGVGVGWGKNRNGSENGNRNGAADGNERNGSFQAVGVGVGEEEDVELYPQAWCCPPGQWTCATATADGDRQAPQRLCQSYLTGSAPTPIWMYWDPAFDTVVPDGSTSSPFEAYTWTADVPAESDPALAATVFRKVFPLVLGSGGGGSDSNAGTGTGTGNPGLGADSSSSDGGGGDSSSDSDKVTEEPPTITVTRVITLDPMPQTTSSFAMAERNRRWGIESESSTGTGPLPPPVLSSLPSSPPGKHVLTPRCLASVLLGAAFLTAVISFVGFALLYRLRRRNSRRKGYRVVSSAIPPAAKAPLEENGKFDVGDLLQPRESESKII